MEPSFITISIDKEIKFKKSELEVLKDSNENDFVKSRSFRVCSISNVKYYISVYPNGDEEAERGKTWIFLEILLGNANVVETDINTECGGKSITTKTMYELPGEGWGDILCTTDELFDPTKKFFIVDEMIAKVKGTLKIYLPSNIIALPFSATWRIRESDLEKLKTPDNNNKENDLFSNVFTISSDKDIEYFLHFDPKHIDEKNKAKAWIFLQVKLGTTVKQIEAFFNVAIESTNFTHDLEHVFQRNEGYGIQICSTDDLFDPGNRYFVDGLMTFKVTGALTMEKNEFKDIKSETETSRLEISDEKDFTIMVGEKSIKVHKQLLLDSSPYFIGMFNSGMIESTEMKTVITDFDYDIVEAGIQMLFNPSKIPTSFTFEQLLDLLRFSDKYDIQAIKNLIQDNFIKNISPTNVCPLLYFTTTTVSAPKLHSACNEYLIKCGKESKAIHGLETLDKDVMAKIFMQFFDSNL